MVPSTLAPAPRVSLLLPTYNAATILDHVLERLAANTTYPDVEVIAVDDGSTDGSGDILRRWAGSGRFPAFRVIEKPNGGAIETLNTALDAATGEVVVQLDADASVETPGWLERMLSLLRSDDRVGAVTVKVVMDSGKIHACGVDLVGEAGFRDRPARLLEPVGSRTWHFRVERVPEGRAPEVEDALAEVDAGVGCCLMYRRSDAVAVGGYDVRYSPVWFDDLDLCLGIRRLGRKVLYLPDVRVIHHTEGRDPAATSPGVRGRKLLKRAVPARVKSRLLRLRPGTGGHTPAQLERIRHHRAAWREKWGWDVLNPDVQAIRERWGDTEVCWRLDPERRAAGEAIVESFESRGRDAARQSSP